MKHLEFEQQQILQNALKLVHAQGVNVGGIMQCRIDTRITINFTPALAKNPIHDRPNSLTIIRNRDGRPITVLQAVWQPGDDMPFIVSFEPGSWKLILSRAVKMMPVSVLPV